MAESPGGPPGTVVIGAGPAGLAAGWELARLGLPARILEMDEVVGGLARTATYRGFRFDIGGHRFFTKVPEVEEIWREILGDDFLERPRLSRIYYRDTFFDYPLKPLSALRGLGLWEAAKIGASFARVKLFPLPEETNFEQWVVNRFGRRLFEIFFETYTEKVWGIPCTEIGAEWAAQRIKNLDLVAALRNALIGGGRRDGEVITTLIDRFHYPRFGPGMMWERCAEILAEQGIETETGAEVVGLQAADGRIESVTVRRSDGEEERLAVEHVLSSMPVRTLVRSLDPSPPPAVVAAAERLRYRDFLTVVLIVDRAELFPDNWIYIHSPKVRVGRIQNFKNWSPEMVPDPSKTALGLEYFVQQGDDLWSAADEELVALGTHEVGELGLLGSAHVEDGTVVRMPKAYPVYDAEYREALAVVRSYVDGLANLQLIGRNGQHRYNNQDHSMLAGIYAARNIAGASYDIWSINTEEVYHEEVGARDRTERAVPAAPGDDLEGLLESAFGHYDPVALGGAVGTVTGVLVFLATIAALGLPDHQLVPTLSLLSNYLSLYRVTWSGALLGLLEGGVLGFVFGAALAKGINLLTDLVELSLLRELEIAKTIDPFEGGGS